MRGWMELGYFKGELERKKENEEKMKRKKGKMKEGGFDE